VIRGGTLPRVAALILGVLALGLDIVMPWRGVARAPAAEESRETGHHCTTLQGHVARGQSFEQSLGDDLVFRLTPDTYGWTIGVIDRATPDDDFAGIATPPYRGTNHRYLEGWHFRNRDNTGPNVGDVNAPQRERGFSFVLTPADYRRAAAAVDTLLWGEHTQVQREHAMTTLEQASIGRGTLRIADMTLGNLVPGVQAWFETLDFDADLCRTP
jgi:hypothetical protein